jgi:hypothetical protein
MLAGKPSLTDVTGTLLALVGLGVVAYLAVAFQSEQAEGAIIALLSAAVGYVYRGRVQPPDPDPGPPAPEGRR